MAAIFEFDHIPGLPLFAQAFVASRMARRAILRLPKEFSEKDRETMLRLCDALDECARVGMFHRNKMSPLLERARNYRGGAAGEAAEALYWAFDATMAADAANDFPVDETCKRDVQMRSRPPRAPTGYRLWRSACLPPPILICCASPARNQISGPMTRLGQQS